MNIACRVHVSILIFLIAVAPQIAAEDEDAMFSGEMIEEQTQPSESDATPGSEFIMFEGIEWGGSLDSRFGVKSSWRGSTYPDVSDLTEGSVVESIFQLDASLYFDARPAADYRVFGKLGLHYPFSTTIVDATDDELILGDVRVEELYTDIPLTSGLLIRFGVFNAGWGTGYFFSPVDVLSTARIDPENPSDERQGPAGFRLSYVRGTTGLSFYLTHNEAIHPRDFSYMQTANFLIGSGEVGLGAWYRYDHPPEAMATLSLPFAHFDVFAEMKATYGSRNVFLVESDNPPLRFDTEERSDDWFVHGTAGLLYARSGPDINAAVQYLYSSSEYGTYELPNRAIDALSSEDPGVIAALASLDELPSIDGLTGYGRHAGAASIGWNDIQKSGAALNCFLLVDIGDRSGYVKPSLSYELVSGFKPYIESTFLFGDAFTGRYTQEGTGWSVSLGAEFGAGNF